MKRSHLMYTSLLTIYNTHYPLFFSFPLSSLLPFFLSSVICLPVLAQSENQDMSSEILPDNYLQDAPADSVIQGYLCPMHPAVTAEVDEQTCYICGMALVDGRIKMPHGSHDSHYGGIFFMARDTWHHIEGTMPAPGVFRFYLYDNYSKPLTTMHASARLVYQEFRDENGDETRPPVETLLIDADDGVSFIVSDRRLQLERDFHIRIRFKQDQKEEDRFDFAFYAYSQTDNPSGTLPTNTSTATLIIPDSPEALLSAMLERVENVEMLIKRSRLNEIYLPALEAKDLALALAENPGDTLDEEQMNTLNHAVKDITKAAWRLDAFGDFGDKPAAESSFKVMADGVARVRKIYLRR